MEDLHDLLAKLPVSDRARDDLVTRLAGPDRHYHGTGHVALLWRRHRLLAADQPVGTEPWTIRIACAIAFHDAIYDARRRDNEAHSAALWRAAAVGLEDATVQWVAETIEATANHLAATPGPALSPIAWQARAWMLDLDFSPLGDSLAEHMRNTANIRREYAHLSDDDWTRGRAAFLRQLAAAPRLFHTELLAARFEASSRANIAASLAALGG